MDSVCSWCRAYFLPKLRQRRPERGARGVACRAAGTDDNIDWRKLTLVDSEKLTDHPTNSIAFDRASGSANGDGQPESGSIGRVRVIAPDGNSEKGVTETFPASIGRVEVRLATQTLLRR
jgi:hypothetical protein